MNSRAKSDWFQKWLAPTIAPANRRAGRIRRSRRWGATQAWKALSLRFSWLLLFLAQSVAAASTNLSPVSVWDVSARVTAGLGYRDNVLRSSLATENSGFFLSTADATFIRLAESGTYVALYLLGEDTRYFDAPSVDYEQFFSGTVQFTTPAGERDELGIEASYLYQHQILDVSETAASLRRVLVDGHSITLHPHWQHALGPDWAILLEGTGFRQIYESELDDYWDGSGRLSLIRTYGNRSEVAVGYQALLRFFDTREQFDEFGIIVPGTSLYYWQHEIGGRWRHHWDEARNWRTASKLSYMFNRDNGSGYFDYDRLLFSEQLRWSAGDWEIKANARFGWYFYKVQQIGGDDRERAYVVLDFRVERRLGKHWLIYAGAEREWDTSNDPLDEYDDWMAGGGIGVEF